MNLEQQVVSLELAKRLKELGVPQESIFYWNKKAGVADFYNHFMPTDREIAAFTVAELLSLIGEPRIVPPEGGADVLAEELIAMYGNKGG